MINVRASYFNLVGVSALLLYSATAAGQDDRAMSEIVVPQVYVKLIQQVEIPARRAGILDRLLVREGAMVKAGDEVARLQDAEAELTVRRADAQWQAARHQAHDASGIDVPLKKLDKERQAAKQRALEFESARRQAENTLRVQASEKARDVARNELDRARQARSQFVDSVSQSELDSLRLTAERAALDAQQAEFERGIDRLKAAAIEEAQQFQQLSIEQAELDVEQSRSLQTIAQYQAELRAAELATAKLSFDQHRVAARFDGVVAQVFRQEGEWLEPGEAIVRIVRLDRLRVEGFLPLSTVKTTLLQAPVVVEVQGEGEQIIRAEGQVVFLSPEVDSVNKEVSLWAEFDNPGLRIKPGMQGRMIIAARQASAVK